MSESETTVLVGQDGDDKTLITCDYGAALIMRIYEDGDVAQLSLDGSEMDKICKAWMEYRAQDLGRRLCLHCGEKPMMPNSGLCSDCRQLPKYQELLADGRD
jgi:hypothetical protein